MEFGLLGCCKLSPLAVYQHSGEKYCYADRIMREVPETKFHPNKISFIFTCHCHSTTAPYSLLYYPGVGQWACQWPQFHRDISPLSQ